jgi:dienelactone hydrolase
VWHISYAICKIMPNFCTSESALIAKYDVISRQLGFHARTHDEWLIWRRNLQAMLRQLLGLDRMLPAKLNPRTTEVVQCDGYRRERVEIDTEPGVTMPMYVLVPDTLRAAEGLTAPAVIAAHGHSSGGKLAVTGVTDDPAVAETVRTHNYNYGESTAQHGYVVFCPDARGFGERRESFSQGADQILNSSCYQLAHMALPLGMTVAGMWTWDLMRLLDYIAIRPECKERKVAAIGLSGGGLQTLWLAALDERVDCAIISGYFYGVKDSLLHLSDNCACNYVPHLWEYADMGDLGALIAPRPLLIESGLQDPLNGPRGIANVMEQYSITSAAYALLDAKGNVDITTFDGPHMWHGAAYLSWLQHWIGTP